MLSSQYHICSGGIGWDTHRLPSFRQTSLGFSFGGSLLYLKNFYFIFYFLWTTASSVSWFFPSQHSLIWDTIKLSLSLCHYHSWRSALAESIWNLQTRGPQSLAILLEHHKIWEQLTCFEPDTSESKQDFKKTTINSLFYSHTYIHTQSM